MVLGTDLQYPPVAKSLSYYATLVVKCYIKYAQYELYCTIYQPYINIHGRSSFCIILIKLYLFLITVLRRSVTLFRAKLPLNAVISVHPKTTIKLY